MSEEPEQPILTDEPQDQGQPNQNNDRQTEAVTAEKTGIKKIISMINKFSGDKKKTRLIITLLGFTFFVLILGLISTLFKKEPGEIPEEAVPSQAPITGEVSPKPTQTVQVSEEVLEDIDDFDLKQQDLQPPSLDLEIGL